jgi:hypothetical protein
MVTVSTTTFGKWILHHRMKWKSKRHNNILELTVRQVQTRHCCRIDQGQSKKPETSWYSQTCRDKPGYTSSDKNKFTVKESNDAYDAAYPHPHGFFHTHDLLPLVLPPLTDNEVESQNETCLIHTLMLPQSHTRRSRNMMTRHSSVLYHLVFFLYITSRTHTHPSHSQTSRL